MIFQHRHVLKYAAYCFLSLNLWKDPPNVNHIKWHEEDNESYQMLNAATGQLDHVPSFGHEST